jgi:hypothetical protein
MMKNGITRTFATTTCGPSSHIVSKVKVARIKRSFQSIAKRPKRRSNARESNFVNDYILISACMAVKETYCNTAFIKSERY